MEAPLLKDISKKLIHFADEMEGEIRDLRRLLHSRPEPSGGEYKTTLCLAEKLKGFGISCRIPPTGRGLLVDSPGGYGDGRVALRADIDALRLQDEKTVLYRSTEADLMHACGHDAHTAMLFGATVALRRCGDFMGTPLSWRSIFQPAEETAHGAREMIDFGAMDKVKAIIALHVDPSLAAGKVGVRYGPLTAFCEEFEISVKGRGGHGARPHQTIDPIAAAAQLVNSVYQTIPRLMDAREPAVVSFGVFQGGINPNVIPESVQLRGTIRTVNAPTSRFIKEKISEIAQGITQSTGATFIMNVPIMIDSVNNHPQVSALCREAAEEAAGKENAEWIEQPSMGGEDFSNYLAHAPGCMLRLGVGIPGEPPRFLHSPRFDIDEQALSVGVKTLLLSTLKLSQPPSR